MPHTYDIALLPKTIISMHLDGNGLIKQAIKSEGLPCRAGFGGCVFFLVITVVAVEVLWGVG